MKPMSGSQDDITRREFVGAAAALSGAAALGLRCGSKEAATATVGIVHRADVELAVRRAIDLAGGVPEIGPGKTVFIKPNAVYAGSLPAITTSLDVLRAVIKVVKERSPQRIIVGDRSARFFVSADVIRAIGMEDAALAAGADEVYAAPTPTVDPSAWVLLQPPRFEETWSAAGGILAMRKLIEADYLVNVPTLKNHRWAVYSLSMKNFIGATGDSSRDAMHYTVGDPQSLSRSIAILNQMFHPLISVIDGWNALINGGPEGLPVDSVRTTPELILASRDRIALDAAAASVIKLELGRNAVPMPDAMNPIWMRANGPWSLPQIVQGIERGLGIASSAQATLQFDSVADADALERIFRAPPAQA
jgi:uncharacterized protein (DUF362 family)